MGAEQYSYFTLNLSELWPNKHVDTNQNLFFMINSLTGFGIPLF